MASLKHFPTLKKLVGVEIYLPYVQEAKIRLLEYFLENPNATKPDIDIIHADAFTFRYSDISDITKSMQTLIIGNPPWPTNSDLGTMDSRNLPDKSNIHSEKGFDAITGKGNFDISEWISFRMLDAFGGHRGVFAFLLKNSVANKIVYRQYGDRRRIGNMEKMHIDSGKEFGISAKACLFIAHLGSKPSMACKESDIYNGEYIGTSGWHGDNFAYSIDAYIKDSSIEGESCFIWRSGVKHDCSKVMELTKGSVCYTNGLGDEAILEDWMVYGIAKSSDLKAMELSIPRKYAIITQKKIGQDTSYIKKEAPNTYSYLDKHRDKLEARKSKVYRDKPDFSIFGIGDYSFGRYKVAISGLYKTTHFTLINPRDEKPIMLDDTCYFIPFDRLEYARIAHRMLNSEEVQAFLKAVVFPDAKRGINKSILMRIDFSKMLDSWDFDRISNKMGDITEKDWEAFKDSL